MDQKTLEKFFNGQLSPREHGQVMQWIEQQGESWTDTFITTHWNNPVQLPPRGMKENVKASVLAIVSNKKPVTRWLNLSRIAAVLLIAAAGAWWWQYMQQPATPAFYIVENEGKGHRMLKDTLPDGTTVTLNEHSRIEYASSYNKKDRTVMLSGEAFFDVHHDKERPFIVKAGNASTRVYGTAFTITAYPASGQLRVGLQRGSIGVTYDTSYTGKEKMLVPGQLLIYNKNDHSVLVENQPPDKLGAWTTGKLVFFKTPANDVLSQLEQRYDVRFQRNNQMQERTLTATFDGVPLSKLLQHISFVWNVRFEQKGDSIAIH